MPDDPVKLPRGTLKAVWAALLRTGVCDSAQTRAVVEEALITAMPLIERAVLRDAARLMLLLDDLDANRICPQCHGKTVERPALMGGHGLWYRCVNDHRWLHSNRGPYTDFRTNLRRLARGEPLPDLPAKEAGDAR